VRIHYDHRVMDGASIARALERFEKILNGEVTDEVRGLPQTEKPTGISIAGIAP
jgi:hypothetical protein